MKVVEIKTTEQTYKPIVLKRAIITCWLLLFVCFALKIFGGNYFAIVVNSPNFVSFCQFLDGNIFLYGLLGLISSLVSYALFYLALLRQLWFTKRQFLVFFASVFVFCLLRVSVINFENRAIIANTINLIQYFAIPFFLGFKPRKNNIARLFIGNILNLGFQVIAAITKSIGVRIMTDSSLTTIIFMIDLYIMLSLYYLYSNNKKKGE